MKAPHIDGNLREKVVVFAAKPRKGFVAHIGSVRPYTIHTGCCAHVLVRRDAVLTQASHPSRWAIVYWFVFASGRLLVQ